MLQSVRFDPSMKLSIFPTNNNEVSQDVLYRKLKQNLLRDQIQIGNQMDFADFLDSKRVNGTDINVWTYDELVEIVDEFKEKNNLKTVYTSYITKEAVEKTGFFSSDTFYYIETILEGVTED